jgi:hypothetical protein
VVKILAPRVQYVLLSLRSTRRTSTNWAVKRQVDHVERSYVFRAKPSSSSGHECIKDPSLSVVHFLTALDPFLRLHCEDWSDQGGGDDRPITSCHFRCLSRLIWPNPSMTQHINEFMRVSREYLECPNA